MVQLQKKARGERPRYFDEPAVEKLMSITLALAGEVAVLRDRIDTIEQLSAAGGPVTTAAIDSYVPDADTRTRRDAWRETFLETIFRIVHQEKEELERKAGHEAYESAVTAVTGV